MKMINIKVDGGLGSQMCKVAAGKSIELKLHRKVRFDIHRFEIYSRHNGFEVCRVFPYMSIVTYKRRKFYKKNILVKLPGEVLSSQIHILLSRVESIIRRKILSKIECTIAGETTETFTTRFDWRYVEKKSNSWRSIYFNSHWLNLADFIEEYETFWYNFFRFNPDSANQQSLMLLDKINRKDYSYVSLHVRRGDYFSDKSPISTSEGFMDICEDGYYDRALSYVIERVINPVFIIFSDDIEWTLNNIYIPGEKIIVNWNNGEDSWQDMMIMSKCLHNITANSSFSMWGAILNQNKNKIITCPRRWFYKYKTDRIAFKNWVKL